MTSSPTGELVCKDSAAHTQKDDSGEVSSPYKKKINIGISSSYIYNPCSKVYYNIHLSNTTDVVIRGEILSI